MNYNKQLNNQRNIVVKMLAIKYFVYTWAAVFAILSIITLKLSLRFKARIKKHPNNIQIDHPIFGQIFKFYIMRLTLLEVVFTRISHYKFINLMSSAVNILLCILLNDSFYWNWSIGVSITILYLILETYVNIGNKSESQNQDVNQSTKFGIIYGFYTLIVSLTLLTSIYLQVFSGSDSNSFYVNFFLSVGIDQIVSKPLLCLIISSGQYFGQNNILRSSLMKSEWPGQEQISISKTAVQPIIRPERFSPTKIPKVVKPSDLHQYFLKEEKPTTGVLPGYEMDSLVNFLEDSNRNKIEQQMKSKSFIMSTPKKKNESKNQIEYQHQLKSSYIEDLQHKYHTPMNILKREMNSLKQLSPAEMPEDMPNQASQIKQLSLYEHNSRKLLPIQIQLSKIQQNNHLQSSGVDSRPQTLTQINTIDIKTKQSRRLSKVYESPQSAKKSKCADYDHEEENISENESEPRQKLKNDTLKISIKEIKEEDENEQQKSENKQSKGFQLVETQQNQQELNKSRIKKIYQEINQNRDENFYWQIPKNSYLEVKDNIAGVQELEELDLNSPIKIKILSKNAKSAEKDDSKITKTRKKPLHKRDLRELKKLVGGSPYLEYLPNMLSKQIIKNKQVSNLTTQPKRNKSTLRRVTNENRKQTETQNNQNLCPQLYLEDF